MTETKDITKATPAELLGLLDETYGLDLKLKSGVNVYDRFDVMWAFRELVIRLRPIVELYDSFEGRLNCVLDNMELTQTHEGEEYNAVRCLREFRVVDVPKLRSEEPELYEELSYVDAATFKRYFGESRMRNMLRAFLNEEGQERQPLPFEKIRLDDLVQELGAGAEQFLTPKRQFGYLFFGRGENSEGYQEKYWNPDTNNGL